MFWVLMHHHCNSYVVDQFILRALTLDTCPLLKHVNSLDSCCRNLERLGFGCLAPRLQDGVFHKYILISLAVPRGNTRKVARLNSLWAVASLCLSQPSTTQGWADNSRYNQFQIYFIILDILIQTLECMLRKGSKISLFSRY